MLKKSNLFKNPLGFTLVELLVVISVLMIIAGVAITVLNPVNQEKKARVAIFTKTVSDLSEALEVYRTQNNGIPVASTAQNVPGTRFTTSRLATWPPTSPQRYYYYVSGNEFVVFTTYSINSSSRLIKYYSDWGVTKDCLNEATARGANDICN